ncbi:MAG: HD domain-containing protein [Prevotella sp.]|nr:HD domain-containing protein [Prevotella sp.]MCM1074909.1 HD domain-containing protein [Ruminococcus sp.]
MNEQLYVPMVDTRAEELFAAMAPRINDNDLLRLKEAYRFAKEAHGAQRRKSGEPYITHPIAVALIAANELYLDVDVVIACLLHDVVEDTQYKFEDIRKRFGDDVEALVRVVTKPDGGKEKRFEMSKQLDNFKHMLGAMRGDIRGILIKLADRLHNMRTLSSMRPDKQMKIAGETDYFYAPLANRLGFYAVKTELENLSFKYRCPHEYADFARMMEADKRRNARRISIFEKEIKDYLAKAGYNVSVKAVYREPYSLWRKLKKRNTDFWHLDGKHFIQIIFPDDGLTDEKSKALKIYAKLTDIFNEKPGSIVNYIDSPKENGYQSFHVKLLSKAGIWEEVHISSERMIEMARRGCMAEGSMEFFSSWFKKFRSTLNEIIASGNDAYFIENVVTSFYNDDIEVFTPQGQPIKMPKKSTALDFAFEVHSKIGEFAKYARINGRLASMRAQLKRGDVVEVYTAEDARPNPDWLNCVVTYKAKRFLRNYIAKLPKVPYKLCDHCKPMPGEEVIGFRLQDSSIEIHKRDCPLAIGEASQHGDSITRVDFKENPDILYPATIRVRGVDRVHMLSDMIECISSKLRLSIRGIKTYTEDNLFDLSISLSVHSWDELQRIIGEIYSINGVDEVTRIPETAD